MHNSKGEILCNRIKNLCKDRGISVAKMCRDLKISQNTVYGLATDEHRNGVSSDNAIKMSKYFGNVPVEYFMDCEYQIQDKKEKPTVSGELNKDDIYKWLQTANPDDLRWFVQEAIKLL